MGRLRVKWYQAVRITEEVQTLRERATTLRYTTLPVILLILLLVVLNFLKNISTFLELLHACAEDGRTDLM
jgi:hypothetical protein